MAKQPQAQPQVELKQDTYLSLDNGKAVLWPDRTCGTRLGKKGDKVNADDAARAGLVNGALPKAEKPEGKAATKAEDKAAPEAENKSVTIGSAHTKGA